MSTPSVGSVISGTMLAEDLIPAFCDLLRELSAENGEKETALIGKALRALEEESDDVDDFVAELFDALDAYAPSYFYFGAHHGDGSDYGYWLSESFEEDFDGLKVDDTSEVPGDYTGEVLHVSDHGNMTLYVATNGNLEEVWAIV